MPNISIDDIEDIDIIDTNYIAVTFNMLSNIFNQMPIFPIPPCLNVHKISLNDEKTRKHVTDIIGQAYSSNIFPPNYLQQISQSTQTQSNPPQNATNIQTQK